MATDPDIEFLADLATPRRLAAWETFLRKYTSLIFRVVRRHESDENRAMDVYLFVCEKLSEADFRRLRKFRRDGPAVFGTWLTTVTNHLCIDWHRKVHGRRHRSALTATFSDLEMIVFREFYERGSTRTECLNSLPDEYRHVTDRELESINARIHERLTPGKRWKLSTGKPVPLALEDVPEIELVRKHGTAANDDPQANLVSKEELAQLEHALTRLDIDERLAIRLRYQEGLSFEQIARATGLESKYRVRILLNGALDKIRRAMSE